MTSIDSSGQAALLVTICEGARVTARGAFNKFLAKDLMARHANLSLLNTSQTSRAIKSCWEKDV